MDDSILNTIKKMLGLEDEYQPFDVDVIVLINSAFMTLTQLGVGPELGFAIKDYTAKWSDFLTNDIKLEAVKQYVYLKVKVAFDPPTSSSVLEAYKQQISELEWRINVHAESVMDFDFIK